MNMVQSFVVYQRFSPLLPAAVLVCLLLATAVSGSAGPLVPAHSRGAGQLIASEELPPSDDFPFGSMRNFAVGSGTATYEGQFTEFNDYVVGVTETADGPALVIRGTLTVIAANGDQLVWQFLFVTPGIPTLPLNFQGTAVLVKGTGRFAGGTGTIEANGTLYEDGSYDYVGRGLMSSIGFNRRR